MTLVEMVAEVMAEHESTERRHQVKRRSSGKRLFRGTQEHSGEVSRETPQTSKPTLCTDRLDRGALHSSLCTDRLGRGALHSSLCTTCLESLTIHSKCV
ncbi:hypothetical protein RRG08_046077 [Elysia crispata]|uniref:Uncharacterized protein n=1 Tax=Elysia crispata TaxID=231223 RepID=A0AAE0Y4T4_9GAST|nr:hypothetical protein RRG08_046077 [Elysia crispata]